LIAGEKVAPGRDWNHWRKFSLAALKLAEAIVKRKFLNGITNSVNGHAARFDGFCLFGMDVEAQNRGTLKLDCGKLCRGEVEKSERR
jgi:hypothetical protein